MIDYLSIDNFDLVKTMECGQCFHYEKIGNKRYIVYGQKSVCEIEQLEDSFYIETDALEYWKSYFALDMNYNVILGYLRNFAEKNNDTFALKSLEKGNGIRILRQPFFETCCSYILSQQNNIPRIRKMVFELSEKYSKNKGYIAGDEFNCFPSPNDLKGVSEEEYKNLGFGYRSAYIKDFVENWDNIIDRVKFDYDSDFNLLKGCKGIGDKVANCICLYGFEEYDAFPIDVWMKRIIKEEYEDKGKKINIPEKYAGILQQYMFYTKRLEARE